MPWNLNNVSAISSWGYCSKTGLLYLLFSRCSGMPVLAMPWIPQSYSLVFRWRNARAKEFGSTTCNSATLGRSSQIAMRFNLSAARFASPRT